MPTAASIVAVHACMGALAILQAPPRGSSIAHGSARRHAQTLSAARMASADRSGGSVLAPRGSLATSIDSLVLSKARELQIVSKDAAERCVLHAVD